MAILYGGSVNPTNVQTLSGGQKGVLIRRMTTFSNGKIGNPEADFQSEQLIANVATFINQNGTFQDVNDRIDTQFGYNGKVQLFNTPAFF